MLGLIGLLFVSQSSLYLFTDNIVSIKSNQINNYLGWVSLGIACLIAFIFIKYKNYDTRQINIGEKLKTLLLIDRYLLYSLIIITLILVLRFFFVRYGKIQSIYPLFGSLYIKPFSFWIPGSLLLGLGWIRGLAIFLEKLKKKNMKTFHYLIYVFIGMIILSTTLALTDNGSTGLTRTFNTPNMQYPEDTKDIDQMGVLTFVKSFNEIVYLNQKILLCEYYGLECEEYQIEYKFSDHTLSHPIGAPLFYYIGYLLFGYDTVFFALYTILFGCLTIIPLFFLLKKILGRNEAYYGIAIFAVIPNVLIFTATSFDTVLMFFSCLTVTLYYYALTENKSKWIIFCSISLFIYALSSYHSSAIGIFLFGLPFYFAKKESSLKPIYRALTVGGITLSLLVIMYLLGYDYLKSFLQTREFVFAIKPIALELMKNAGFTAVTRFVHWSVSSYLAFLIYLGIPAGYFLLKISEHKKIISNNQDLKFFEFFIIIIIIILNLNIVASVEHERIWLFLVPFLTVPITKIVVEKIRETQFNGILYSLLVISFLQTWVFQLTLNTKW